MIRVFPIFVVSVFTVGQLVAEPARYQSRDGHPADHLPSYIRQVSDFGERPEWSHNSKRIFSVYQIKGETNADTYSVDTKTGQFRNLTNSPDLYDESEGVFPDGTFTCVEHAPSLGKAWPLCDIYKL